MQDGLFSLLFFYVPLFLCVFSDCLLFLTTAFDAGSLHSSLPKFLDFLDGTEENRTLERDSNECIISF